MAEMMTQPPVTPGTIPDFWTALIAAAQQMNTSIQTIQDMNITTFGGLVEYMQSQGYYPEFIQTISETFECWVKVTPVDATETTDVAVRVATDVATTGGAGTAVSTFASGGNRVLTLVTKVVAVSAAMALLISTIGAGVVPPEIEEDLITSADPFTIDGEHVPVLVDENGKAYFSKNFLEAVRAKMVELGVFNVEDEPEVLPDGTFIPTSNYMDFQSWFDVFVNKWSIGTNNPFTRWGITASDYYDLITNWFTTNNLNINDYVYCGNATQTAGYLLFLKKNRYTAGA